MGTPNNSSILISYRNLL